MIKVWLLEQREEDRTVGVLADGGGDLPLELADLLVERVDHRDHAAHEFSAGAELELADAGDRGAAKLGQKLRGRLPAGVVLADEEPLQARCSQPVRVRGAGVALEERERDRAVQARGPQRFPYPRSIIILTTTDRPARTVVQRSGAGPAGRVK